MNKNKTDHFVYIIECQNGSYYTGYTTDVERRYQEHCKGTPKCRYTQSFPPKKLVAAWRFDSKQEAMQVEYQIKQYSRQQKMALIKKSSNSTTQQP